MTDTRGPLPIVVGVDGSAPALRALDWSVAEAVAMHRPLHIVHCLTGPLMRYPFVSSGTGPPDGGFRVAAQRVLTDALQYAQSAAPNIRVTTELVLDAPVSTLLRKALDAEFLVVGSGASTHLVGIRAESVGLTLAAHAPCPLVVVHSIPGDDPRHYEGGIVVGVARSHPSGLLSSRQRAGRSG